jgi:hypothetical protein
MSRDSSQVESLIQELHAFYGEDLDFAILNDVVRGNTDAADESIFELLSQITGRLYSRPEKVIETEPEEPAPTSASSVLARLTKASAKQSPKKPKKTSPKSPVVVDREHNAFQALDTDAPEAPEKKPFESIWKTVLKEHGAPVYDSKPDPDPRTDIESFEEVDVSALEDVDPIAFQIANNPELRGQATVPLAYDHGLFNNGDPISIPPAGFRPIEPREPKKPEIVIPPPMILQPPSISSEPILQNSYEEPNMVVLMPGGSVLPTWMVNTLSPSISLSPVPSISSTPVITVSSDSTASQAQANSMASSGPILMKQPTQSDFWLPPPPTNEEEAKRILEQLALSSSSQGSIRASAKWSHSGDYAIAPSPSAIRFSVGSQASPSGSRDVNDYVTPGNPDDDFKLDTEALDFLGQIFPDFELSYLADCLRGAENDVQRVSEFLLPVEMENIDLDDEELEEVYDYSQHIIDRQSQASSHPVFEFPTYLLSDRHFYGVSIDAPEQQAASSHYHVHPHSQEHQYPDLEDVFDHENEQVDLTGDEDIPEADAKFNSNYASLLETFDGVDPDLVLEALINHDNDIERAAEEIMTRQAAGESQATAKPIKTGRPNRGRGGRRGGRRNAGRQVIPLDKPNAWARPLPGPMPEPLSGFPDLDSEMLARGPKDGSPIVIRPARHGGAAAHIPSQLPAHLLLPSRGTFAPRSIKRHQLMFPDAPGAAPEEIARPTYVPALSRAAQDTASTTNWISLMQQANAIFEKSGANRLRAVTAYKANRKGAIQIVNSFQSNTENWISLVEQAGREFYASGAKMLDLHGLRLRPATKFVAAILQAHWEVGDSDRAIEIITGRGAHSVDGVARIKEDVRRQIRDYPHVWTNPGSVRVLLPRPRPRY